MLRLQGNFSGSICAWFRYAANYWSLTFSRRLFWLSMYVISIAHRLLEADILATVALAQLVRDFDCLQTIGV